MIGRIIYAIVEVRISLKSRIYKNVAKQDGRADHKLEKNHLYTISFTLI